ncbi:MAG TPA: lipopolysaccharide biosynthesis protein [Candidatus Eisenbacteria bacterium]|nr:lipopolysaccharide biosynthesis protein [Candidatus Eisenbacteria bacterium]
MATDQQIVYGVGSSAASPANAGSFEGASLLTRQNLKVWGARAVFSLLDQGLASGASFGVNLLLARWLITEAYGAFAVGFVSYMFVYGLYNALLLEPMSVLGPAQHIESMTGYLRSQLMVHIIVVSPLAGLTLVAGILLRLFIPASPLGGALVGLGLALPFLLLLWFARRIGYVLQRPSQAGVGSALFLTIVAAGLLALQHYAMLQPFTAFALMGFASCLSAVYLIRRFGLVSWQTLPREGWGQTLRENWGYGRWLVGSTVLAFIVSQAQVFFVSGLLGLGAAGILRAMQLPALLMTQISTAAGFLILPIFSYDFVAGATRRMRHKAIFTSLALSTLALVLAGATWTFSAPIERILFSGKFAPYAWLMPLLVLYTIPFGPMQGFGMALRAIRMPKFDLVSGAIAAPVAVFFAYLGTRWWGLGGAALSLILGFAVQGLVTAIYFRRFVPESKTPLGVCPAPLGAKQNV